MLFQFEMFLSDWIAAPFLACLFACQARENCHASMLCCETSLNVTFIVYHMVRHSLSLFSAHTQLHVLRDSAQTCQRSTSGFSGHRK